MYDADRDGVSAVFLPFEPKEISSSQPVRTSARPYGGGSRICEVKAESGGETRLTVRG
ncbi:MAG: hypothetical protein IKP22_12225 [Clostridia bacterium]|nr:hypothetical protein [Clostridia bacterium]